MKPTARVVVTYTDGTGQVRFITAPKGKKLANVRLTAYWAESP